MNITIPHSEKQQNKEMKIVVFAIIIYAAYLILRLIFRSLAAMPPKQKNSPPADPPRKVDMRNIEDAEFEEIKKD